jgi:spermidine synthase
MKFKKYILEIVVFVSGAVVMVFELVGSRVLAPYLGTSLVIWTSLIGVILGSLSLGYYLGGKLADKKPHTRTFSLILLGSGIAIGLTAVFKIIIIFGLQSAIKDLRINGIMASLLLFAPASILLGMVSPYAVRLKLLAIETSGKTVGNLYAISTVGSISGTFIAGFYLIPLFGTSQVIYGLALVMIAVSVLASRRGYLKTKVGALVIVMVLTFITAKQGNFIPNNGLVDIDTRYNRLFIIDGIDWATKKPARFLKTDPHGFQGAVFLDGTDDLVFDYTKFYRLYKHFNPGAVQALLIGGGVYSVPHDFLSRNQAGTIDVVEIDSELTELARNYFNLNDEKRMNIYHEDGRTFLNNTNKQYDAIFIDAFNSHLSIPFQLTTLETVERVYKNLADNGVVLVNIVSGIKGEKGKFLRAELATYQQVFPQTFLFPVWNKIKAEEMQNIMLVALKSDQKPEFKNADKEINSYLANLITSKIELDMPVLTDNHAPVDYYTMKIL